ncbi:MAG: hypothetical protein KKD31_09715, partial [Bacteroidetes bacterium]|nr:hypothetical protein [Bacteroidota bacterium]
TLNQWYYIIGEKSGSTFTLYVDGVQVDQGTIAEPKDPGNAVLWFGGAPVILKEFKIFEGSLRWYSGSCGGTLVGKGPTIQVSPASTTTFYVRAEGSCSASGCTSTTVTVDPTPVAASSISVSSTSLCSGSSVTVTRNGGGVGQDRWWMSRDGVHWDEFSDGYAGSSSWARTLTVPGSNPSYTYQVYHHPYGGACGWDGWTHGTWSPVITVYSPSVGGTVSGGTTPICNGGSTGTMTLSGHTGSIVKWQKRVNAGGWTDITNTTTTYSETPSSAGTWEYRAVIQNGPCGSANSAARTIIVNPDPSISGQPSNSSFCPGGNTNFSVSVSNGVSLSYQWQYNSGSWNNVANGTPAGSTYSNQTTATLTVSSITTPGSYQYRCIISDAGSGCTTPLTSNTATLTVNSNSTAATSISATSNPICSGNSTTLSVVGGSLGTGASWKWYTGSCGGTYIGVGASVVVSPGSTTTYYVRAEGTCNTTGCVSTTITVNSAPAAAGTISGTSSTCMGTSGVPFSVGAISGATSYVWAYSGSGATINGSTNSVTVDFSASATSGNLTVYGTNSCGNGTASPAFSVTVSNCSPGFVNNGARIYIGPTAQVYVDGNANGDFTCGSLGTCDGAIILHGKFILEGDWTNNATGDTNTVFTSIEATPNGEIHFIGTTMQTVGGANITNFENVVINNTTASGSDYIDLAKDMDIYGTLTLLDGVIRTNANKVIVRTTGASGASGSNTSYVNGNLRRYMASASAEYQFPLGYGGNGTTNYHNIVLVNNALTWPGSSYIDSKVGVLTNHLDADLVTADVMDFGTPYTSMATQAMWTLTPNNAPAGTYDLRCYIANISGLVDYKFGLLKRPNGTNGLAWTTSGGVLNASNGDGRLVAHGYSLRKTITGFSEIGVAKSLDALPVSLLDFSGTCDDNDRITLQWKTATETNNSHFTVEKSDNGSNFSMVSTIPGAGTSNSIIEYFAYDDYLPGFDYYRLSQTDFDGTLTLLPTISVTCQEDYSGNPIWITIDPGSNSLTITLLNGEIQPFELCLYNDIGQLILCENHEVLSPDPTEYQLQFPNLARGIYLLVFRQENEIKSYKIMLH